MVLGGVELMFHVPVTGIYAALLGLMFLRLSINVIRQRRRAHIALGTGGDAGIERAARVHGNFAEYVPLLLGLIYLVEASGYPAWWVHVLGSALLAGRVAHAFGVSRSPEVFLFRTVGMVVTFLVLLVAAVMLLAAAALGQ